MTSTQQQQNMMQNQAMQQPMMKMAKGGKFPDLTGDGKVTQKDILKGRGVID